MTLPIIGITMGDPTGIGPEIIVNSAENSGSRPNFTFSISFRKQVSSISSFILPCGTTEDRQVLALNSKLVVKSLSKRII